MTFCFTRLLVLSIYGLTSFILLGLLRLVCQPHWITAGRKGFTGAFYSSAMFNSALLFIINVHVPVGDCVDYMQWQRCKYLKHSYFYEI